MKRKKIFRLLLVLGMMGIIFSFSCQDATKSGAESSRLTQLLYWVFGTLQINLKTEYFEIVETLIRKLAHCTEYAILGITISNYLVLNEKRGRQLVMKTILIGALYAATDEFHQLFVPGRSGQILDVGIDTLGVTIGALLFAGFIHWRRKKGASKSRES